MITITIRGKVGNRIRRSYHGTIEMHVEKPCLIIDSTRIFLGKEIHEIDMIYLSDILDIRGN